MMQLVLSTRGHIDIFAREWLCDESFALRYPARRSFAFQSVP